MSFTPVDKPSLERIIRTVTGGGGGGFATQGPPGLGGSGQPVDPAGPAPYTPEAPQTPAPPPNGSAGSEELTPTEHTCNHFIGVKSDFLGIKEGFCFDEIRWEPLVDNINVDSLAEAIREDLPDASDIEVAEHIKSIVEFDFNIVAPISKLYKNVDSDMIKVPIFYTNGEKGVIWHGTTINNTASHSLKGRDVYLAEVFFDIVLLILGILLRSQIWALVKFLPFLLPYIGSIRRMARDKIISSKLSSISAGVLSANGGILGLASMLNGISNETDISMLDSKLDTIINTLNALEAQGIFRWSIG